MRVAPEPETYGGTYSHSMARAELIAAHAVDHRPIQAGGIASVNHPLEFYPTLAYDASHTQGHYQSTDVDVFTGTTFVPRMEDYTTQQPAYWYTNQ